MSELDFHIHNDLGVARKAHRIPLIFTAGAECYIMQEDRIVFVGSIEPAKNWVKANNGNYIKDKYAHLYRRTVNTKEVSNAT